MVDMIVTNCIKNVDTPQVIKKSMNMNSRTYLSLAITLIWLRAESFRPVMSRTLTQVVIGPPFFLDTDGCNSFIQIAARKKPKKKKKKFSHLTCNSH